MKKYLRSTVQKTELFTDAQLLAEAYSEIKIRERRSGEQMMETYCFLILFTVFYYKFFDRKQRLQYMSNLKNVRAELEKMKKEMAAKEAELKREEARPVIELINNELLNSDAVQEKMSAYSKDEARVIAKHIVKNIDAIISESQGEINELRAKKKERAEKRKAAKLDRELEKMAAEDDYEDDGMYGTNQFEEPDPYETGQLQ